MTRSTRFFYVLLVTGLLASCRPASDADREASTRDVRLARDATTVEGLVPRNATLESLLQEQLPADLARSVVDAVAGVFNPRRLRADQAYRVTRGLDGLLREFRYDIDADNLLRVVFRGRAGSAAPSFDVAVEPVPKAYHLAAASARISQEHNSLIAAFDATGENMQLPLLVADVFGGEVDFNSELQLGDAVQVLFDRSIRDGEFVGYGDVKAAVLTLGRRRLTAIRYVGADGRAAFYDEDGRSTRRQFLKSPLPFNPRVTSGFSRNRFHPVHGSSRPHLGVDYGAPFGTPVNAVAAGVVVAAEWAGEAGRMVRLRHTGGYETAYLHLSSFGPDIRPGKRVEQGMLIGRVGQTGTATGPHLDYRIIRNGTYLNPVTALSRMPQGEPIASGEREAFARYRDQAVRQLRERLTAAAPDASAPAVAP